MRYEFDNIPESLRQRKQWLLWSEEERDGDLTKVPKQPSGAFAKSTDPDTWTSFSEAREAYVGGDFDGIGFVFTEDGPFVGVDLDGCVKDGDLTGGAWDLVKRLDSYTEGSPSGTGLHIICRGFLPDLGNRTSDVPGLKELELYDSGRYFTFTGRHLDSTPETVENRAQEIYDLCRDVFGEKKRQPAGTAEPIDVEDEELIEKAKSAKNGDKFSRLWRGDISDHDNDHSRADQALVNLLAYWTGGDRDRIDQLFRQSGLCREKWTERPDYRQRTIDKALEGRTEFYEPHRQNGQASDSSPENDTDPWSKICGVYQDDKGQARMRAAEQVISDLEVATHRKSGHLYVWDPGEKVYTEDGEQSIRSLLVDKLGSNFSQHDVREIIGFIKPKTYRRQFGAEGYIPVANGDLKVTADGVEVAEATPERGFRNRSPAEWDPEAEAPLFHNYLEQVVKTEEERKTLQEYAGYALAFWTLLYHKALFLVGPEASGKSTFLKVLQELLGKTTQLSPQQLVDEKFGAIELEDSWANIASDIPSSLLSNVNRFKEITAGDPIHARRIYEQGYTIEPTAKHFYSANQLPEVKIDDDAFFRRVMIVAFPETIEREQRDEHLDEKLEMELDGILRWAIEGFQRLIQNGGFTRDLPPSETRRLWDEHASSIGQFKIRFLDVTGHHEDVEPKTDVYDAYGRFCINNGLSAESQNKFTRVLTRDPRIGHGDRTPEGWDKQADCYIGLRLPAEGTENDEPPF